LTLPETRILLKLRKAWTFQHAIYVRFRWCDVFWF
jgi:hypothetical protein